MWREEEIKLQETGAWECLNVRGTFCFAFYTQRKNDLVGRDGKYERAPLIIEPFRARAATVTMGSKKRSREDSVLKGCSPLALLFSTSLKSALFYFLDNVMLPECHPCYTVTAELTRRRTLPSSPG